MTRYPHAQSTIKPPTSPGTCFICDEKFSGDVIEEHLQSCLPSMQWKKGDEPSLLIRITDKYSKKFWLLILASPDASLKDLNIFIESMTQISLNKIFFVNIYQYVFFLGTFMISAALPRSDCT